MQHYYCQHAVMEVVNNKIQALPVFHGLKKGHSEKNMAGNCTKSFIWTKDFFYNFLT
jgi:hypothetical protein